MLSVPNLPTGRFQPAHQPVPMLDLKRQYEPLQQELLEALQHVLETQQFILGEQVAAFEKAAAQHLGVNHAIGCSSGTDALWLALAACWHWSWRCRRHHAFQLLRLGQRDPPGRSHAPSWPISIRSPSTSIPGSRSRPGRPAPEPSQSHPARPPLRPMCRLGCLLSHLRQSTG